MSKFDSQIAALLKKLQKNYVVSYDIPNASPDEYLEFNRTMTIKFKAIKLGTTTTFLIKNRIETSCTLLSMLEKINPKAKIIVVEININNSTSNM